MIRPPIAMKGRNVNSRIAFIAMFPDIVRASNARAVLDKKPIMYRIRCNTTVAVDSPSRMPVSLDAKMHLVASRKTPLGIMYIAKMLAKVIP
jgi:hypothetical protein